MHGDYIYQMNEFAAAALDTRARASYETPNTYKPFDAYITSCTRPSVRLLDGVGHIGYAEIVIKLPTSFIHLIHATRPIQKTHARTRIGPI